MSFGASTRTRLPTTPDWAANAAIVAGVALILAGTTFAQRSGSALGPKTWVEIVLLLGGAAIVVTRVLRTGGGGSGDLLPVVLLSALAVLTACSIGWAVNPADAWLVANRLFSYVAVFAAAAALALLAPRRWPALIGGVLLALVTVCGYGLLTKALPGQLSEIELFARLREPFGYWNAIGLAGALAVPPALWLGARREGPPLINALAYPALTVCLAATLMAYSRGALLAAVFGLVLWFVLSPLRLRGATVLLVGGAGAAMIGLWSFGQEALTTDGAPLADRQSVAGELLVLLVAVVLLVYVAGLVAGFLADWRPMREVSRRRAGVALLVGVALVPFAAAGVLASTDAGLGGSISNGWRSLTDTSVVGPANDPSRLTATGSVRSRYWEQAFDMWKEEPALGIGAGGYGTAHLRFRRDLLDVRHAHGFVPETLAELGLAGLVLSLALLSAWALAARRALRGVKRRDLSEHAGLVTLAAIVVVFGAHSLIDLTWTIPGVAIIGLVASGWLAGAAPARRAARTDGAPPPQRSRPYATVAASLVALLAVAAAWSVWQPLSSARAADAAVAAMQRGDLQRARSLAETARRRNPLSVEPLLDLAAIEARAGRKREAERALEKSVALQPANWLPWMRLADHRLFELRDPEGALEAVRVAIYLNPRSWDVYQRFLDARRAANAREPRRTG